VKKAFSHENIALKSLTDKVMLQRYICRGETHLVSSY